MAENNRNSFVSDMRKWREAAEEKALAELEKKKIHEDVLDKDLEPEALKGLLNNEQGDEKREIVVSALRRKLNDFVTRASEKNENLEDIIEKFYSIDEYVQIYEGSDKAKELGLLRNAITNIYNSEKNRNHETIDRNKKVEKEESRG